MGKMMLKTTLLSSALVLCVASVARSGDTVTVNMPGGATQTAAASSIVAAINDAGGAVPGGGGGEDSIIASISQDTATGDITIVTTGGQSYTVNSAFIGSMLAYYGG
jgi:hypothetical protein